ncbi:hypothetical protein CAP35_03320 [Chitinophagaceae bacterium IBVUCB1]|nr:hypothetical protein CAP35_03320 [Chitinophagaceae bacterium IBVUCB1]
MEFNTGERGNATMLRAEYWTIGRWFSFLIIFTLAWAGIYLAVHSSYGVQGHEYAGFNTQQVRQINRILTSNAGVVAIEQAPPQQPVNFIDSSVSSVNASPNEVQTMALGCDMNCRAEKVLLYVNSEFDGKVAPEQLQSLKQYISTFAQQDVGIFLADYKLKVRSYFWLAGPLIYAEVVFWVVIGVVCSVLFATGNALRRKNKRGFENKEIMYQLAKFFYAPFLAVVILLAYNYFNHTTTLSTALGQGIIVFAFIAGFFAGRFMNFLDRLKRLILPAAGEDEEQSMPSYNQAHAPAQQVPVTAHVSQIEAVEAMSVDENGELSPAMQQKKKDGELVDVEVEVKLDNSGLFDEERDNIISRGFSKAIVTLHNVNGKEIIPAKKTLDKDNAIFTAYNVKPGIYIARATLSQKLQDEHIINLFGERTTYITADKPGLELYIRKYELID